MSLTQEERANAALNFLAAVEEEFRGAPDNYDLFLEYMSEYNQRQITALFLVEQVARLLYKSIALMDGLNAFLPAGWEVKSVQDEGGESAWTVTIKNPEGTFLRRFSEVPAKEGEDETRGITGGVNEEFKMMVELVQAIKDRYSTTPQVYEEFIRLINPNSNVGSRQDIFLAVKDLLKDSPELVSRFQTLVIDD